MQIPSVNHEPLTFEQIRALVGRDDPTIVEVGANVGQDTRRFLGTFPEGRVFCFEPDARAIARWRLKVRDPRATLVEAAVGSADGTVTFHVSGGRKNETSTEEWNRSGSIRTPKTHLERWPWVSFPTTVEVASVRLDTWLAAQDIDRIDFLWADVQGAEGDLIAGAAKALSMTRYFYTEYSNEEWYEGQIDLAALVGLLPDFEVAEVFPMDVLFRRRGG